MKMNRRLSHEASVMAILAAQPTKQPMSAGKRKMSPSVSPQKIPERFMASNRNTMHDVASRLRRIVNQTDTRVP